MDLNNIRFIGRHIIKDGKPYFSYSGCGFEFVVNPTSSESSVDISLKSELKDEHYQFVNIYLNDELYSTEKLDEGLKTINIPLNNKTTVRVVKLNEVYLSSIYINGIVLHNCMFEAIKPSNRKLIGFFGDSITCGYGVLDYHGEVFKMEGEDFTKTYARLACLALNMDYSVVARSGISMSIPIYCDKLFGEIYDTVDMYEKCEENRKLDYAVINLGTNDSGAYPIVFKGEDRPEEVELFKERYIALVKRIVDDNPGVKIVLVSQMLPLREEFIEAIIEVYNSLALSLKDNIKLLECVPNSDGASGHPYLNGHEEASKLLINAIKSFEK